VRRDGDLTILILGDELARDLDGTPAMAQGNLIYARSQTLAFYLWERLADPTECSNRFLKIALPTLGLRLRDLVISPQSHQEQFCLLLISELEAVIHHEIGEAREESLRTVLPRLLELFPQSRLELWIRSLKDALAEVNEHGRLAYLIAERNLASLGLMLAFQPGLYPLLLPELEPAFWEVAKGGDWEPLEKARQAALWRLRRDAADLNRLLDLHRHRPPQELQAILAQRFLAPLGL